MKVFGVGGGAYSSDYMAAIEDAIVLDCDSVNLSLGSAAVGFTTPGEAYFDNVMDSLDETDTVVCMSAGNSGNWAETPSTACCLPRIPTPAASAPPAPMRILWPSPVPTTLPTPQSILRSTARTTPTLTAPGKTFTRRRDLQERSLYDAR